MSAQQTEFKETNSDPGGDGKTRTAPTTTKRSRVSAGFLTNIRWALGPRRCCYSPL